MKIGLLVYRDGKLEKVLSSEPVSEYIVVIPRENLYVDKISMPKVAVENGNEAVQYQAERIFGEEDLKASHLIVEEESEKVEVLIIAVKSSVLAEIEQQAAAMDLSVRGVTLATLAYMEKCSMEQGVIWTRWESGVEAAEIEGGEVRNIFFVSHSHWEKVRSVLGKEAKEFALSDISTLSSPPLLLFKVKTKKAKRGLNIPLAVGILLLIGLSALFASMLTSLNAEKKRLSLLQRKQKSYMKVVNELSKLKEEKKKLQQQLDLISKNTKGISLIRAIARISDVLPKGTLIGRLYITGKKVRLMGYSTSASQVIEKLGKSKYVKNLKIEATPYKRRFGPFKDMETFTVSMELEY